MTSMTEEELEQRTTILIEQQAQDELEQFKKELQKRKGTENDTDISRF